MKNQLIIVGLLILGVLGACSQKSKLETGTLESKKNYTTETGLNQCKSQAENLLVSAKLGGSITTTDGSKILVAPHSFVYADGTPVVGDVTLTYYPINSIAEIVASGIPMLADNNGTEGQFISDGMFELNASVNGKSVFIAKEKEIKVFTAVRDKESDFKYWYFDKDKGKWNEIGARDNIATKANISASEMEMGIAKAVSYNHSKGLFSFAGTYQKIEDRTIPGKYDPSRATLDINFDEKAYPELAEYSRIMWQYAGTEFENDPEQNQWIFQNKWTNVSLEPHPTRKMVFNLTIFMGTRKFETTVRPVVTGKDLERAEALYAQEIATKLETPKIKPDANVTTIEQNMYNAFSVSRLGVYNCDRFYSDENAFTYNPEYYYNGENISQNKTIYFLTDNKNGVIQFSSQNYMLKLRGSTVNAIFTVAETGAIAVATAASLQGMKESKGGRIKLNFEKLNIKINGPKSLISAIAAL